MRLERARRARRSQVAFHPDALLGVQDPSGSVTDEEVLGVVSTIVVAAAADHLAGSVVGEPGLGRVRSASKELQGARSSIGVWIHVLLVERLDGRGLGALAVVVGSRRIPPAALEIAHTRLASPSCASW